MKPTDNEITTIIRKAVNANLAAVYDSAARGSIGVVVAGATGIVCRHTLDGLSRAGIRPLALVDNNQVLHGTTGADGIPIMSPSDAVSAFPDAVFVASIFTHTPLRNQLRSLGASRVVSYSVLFHKYPEAFLPFFAVDDPSVMAAEEESVLKAVGLWADAESAELYRSILDWFVTLDSDSVAEPLPADATYIPDFLKLRTDEIFVDCGAFDGDTLRHYVRVTGGNYQRILAIEPDPQTFDKLEAYTQTLERVFPINAAVGAEQGQMSFVAGGLASSHAAQAGAAGISAPGTLVEVDVIRLDDLAVRPTYVKMDIEGFELQALEGARDLLREAKTVFAVTLYHRMNDLWKIPEYIHGASPDLKLFLRHYAEDWSETVCYAVPEDRLK